jgi:hypothetical protein
LVGLYKENGLEIGNIYGQSSYFHEEVKVVGVESYVGGWQSTRNQLGIEVLTVCYRNQSVYCKR